MGIILKINLYGEIINRFEYLKYTYGKYIPKNVDPIVDRIRKDRRKNIIYFLPFLLMLFFIIIVLMNS
jgi:dolichol kinase